MSVKDVLAYILDIINSIRYIREFTDSISFDDFKKQYPLIPWKIMAGMRDRLIHW